MPQRVQATFGEPQLRLRMMRVAVTGATGFIGAVLARALTDEGHDVTALTRHPGDYTGAGRAVYADIGDAESLRRALDGQQAAYYLVHSLAVGDFAVRDREGAAAAADDEGRCNGGDGVHWGGPCSGVDG